MSAPLSFEDMHHTAAKVEREAIEAALAFFGRNAESVVYGHFHGGDPRDFTPDPECSTDEERAKWEAACARWNAGNSAPQEPFEVGPHTLSTITEEQAAKINASLVTADGHEVKAGDPVRVTWSGFGLGTNVYRDEEICDLRDKMRAALGGKALETRAEKEAKARRGARSEWKRARRKVVNEILEAADEWTTLPPHIRQLFDKLDAINEKGPAYPTWDEEVTGEAETES